MALLTASTAAASSQCAKKASPQLIGASQTEPTKNFDLDELARYTSALSASNDKLVIGGSFYESGLAGIAQVDLTDNSVDFMKTFMPAQAISALSFQSSDLDNEILALAAQDLHDEDSKMFLLRLGPDGQDLQDPATVSHDDFVGAGEASLVRAAFVKDAEANNVLVLSHDEAQDLS